MKPKNMIIAGAVVAILMMNFLIIGLGHNHLENTKKEMDLIVDETREQYSWWARSYGTSDYDSAYGVDIAPDGGYIMVGYGYYSDPYFWIVKLNADGTVQWDMELGLDNGYGYDVKTTSDGGCILSGSGGSSYGDVHIIKLNSSGDIEWDKKYGGNNGDTGYSIIETSDGGYLVGATTYSFGSGNSDLWILKLNSDGTIAWQKTFGGSDYDDMKRVYETSNGDYLVVASTKSFGVGNYDMWLIKINSTGSVLWAKTFGSSDYDYGADVVETSSGDYILTGRSRASGNYDVWVIRMDSDGSIIWKKSYGGSSSDYPNRIIRVGDYFVVAGGVNSYGAGGSDAFLMKINGNGNIIWQRAYGGSDDDLFSYVVQDGQGFIAVGSTKSFGAGEYDWWAVKTNSTGFVDFNSGSGATLTNINMEVSDAPVSVQAQSITPSTTSVTPQDVTEGSSSGNYSTNTQSDPVEVPEMSLMVMVIPAIVVAFIRWSKRRK